jgi:hypothetical protein
MSSQLFGLKFDRGWFSSSVIPHLQQSYDFRVFHFLRLGINFSHIKLCIINSALYDIVTTVECLELQVPEQLFDETEQTTC